jgi:hypothetical protein
LGIDSPLCLQVMFGATETVEAKFVSQPRGRLIPAQHALVELDITGDRTAGATFLGRHRDGRGAHQQGFHESSYASE